jgi:hypothetical protein
MFRRLFCPAVTALRTPIRYNKRFVPYLTQEETLS